MLVDIRYVAREMDRYADWKKKRDMVGMGVWMQCRMVQDEMMLEKMVQKKGSLGNSMLKSNLLIST